MFNKFKYSTYYFIMGLSILLLGGVVIGPALALAGNLNDIRQRGVLRHLGITYAHFVRETPQGYDGLDVEVMRLFAEHLGVKYQLVNTTWDNLFEDLTGFRWDKKQQVLGTKQTNVIKGDIIANGLTMLPWRKKIVTYSRPTFPTGVWLVANARSPLNPISPSGNIAQDIKTVKALLKGHSVLTMDGTCLASGLYDLEQTQAEIKLFTQGGIINDIVPAMMNGQAECTLLDIPDAMIALQQWSGEIKIIGPISGNQVMGVAVAHSSEETLNAFNAFFKIIWQNGTYRTLVEKYYPSVFLYFEDFFNQAF